MKKTLNLTILAAFAVVFAFSTVSCNKDDGPSFDSGLLVGNWYLSYENFVATIRGEEPYVDEDTYTKANSPTFIHFDSDGTGMVEDEGDEGSFGWSLRGDKLTLRYEDEEVSITVKELTSTTLTTYDKDVVDDGEIIEQTSVFTKY